MAEHIVKVRGIEVSIQVWQESKTVWKASGAGPTGKRLDEIKGRTESDAVRQWRQAAEYHNI